MSMDRRNFIKVSLTILGTLLTVGACTSVCPVEAQRQSVRWAFLSDTHIVADPNDNYRGFHPYDNLSKAVSEIVSDPPDAVAITGDLARLQGKSDDYANLKELLAPLAARVPVYMALGNHDDRDNFRRTFTDLPGERPAIAGKHVTIVHTPPVRLVLLDSLLYVNKVPGLLGRAQRQWLEDYLKTSDDTPTILCVHHTLGDDDGELLDVSRLFRIIEPVRKVKAILYGHSHEYGFSEFEGIHLINVPATGYNFNDAECVGWVEARLSPKGGEFILHAMAGNRNADGSMTKLIWRE